MGSLKYVLSITARIWSCLVSWKTLDQTRDLEKVKILRSRRPDERRNRTNPIIWDKLKVKVCHTHEKMCLFRTFTVLSLNVRQFLGDSGTSTENLQNTPTFKSSWQHHQIPRFENPKGSVNLWHGIHTVTKLESRVPSRCLTRVLSQTLNQYSLYYIGPWYNIHD